MKSVLIANKNSEEAFKLQEVINKNYDTNVIISPKGLNGELEKTSLVLLDHNFTEYSGVDFLVEVLKTSFIPVLMMTPPDDAMCAIEAMRAGAYNYIVKAGDYHNFLSLSIKEAIEKFNEKEQMKQTIIVLKNQVKDLESRLEIQNVKDVHSPASKNKTNEKADNIAEEIIARFKSGEINLPSMPKINVKFRELTNKGANIQEVANLLKQDVAISSKLISVSNSVYYKGIIENKTVEQSISRLGIDTTRRYVDVISNRALYTTNNKKFVDRIDNLWKHSLSCAYASQILTEVLKLKLSDDAFTLGLLHDIGKLILLQVVSELELKGHFGEEIDKESLSKTLDQYHGKFGAALLKKWKFSSVYSQVAMYHSDLSKADTISKGLLVVHNSNLLVKSMGFHHGNQVEIDFKNAESTRLLRVSPRMIDDVKGRVRRLMKALNNHF